MNFVRAILTDMGAVSSGSVDLASDWRKCDVVARVLVQLPKVKFISNVFIIQKVSNQVGFWRVFLKLKFTSDQQKKIMIIKKKFF